MKRTYDKIILKLRQDNFALVVCFVLSLVLWLVIQLSKTYEQPQTVKLVYKVPTGMTLSQPPPSELVAVVEASGWKLLGSAFRTSEYQLEIDLKAYGSKIIEREELYQRLSSQLGLPVVETNRNYLLFSLDSTNTKTVPVVFDNQIQLARDFFLAGPVSITPDSIILTGPKQELAKVDVIKTVPFTAVNVNRSLQADVALIPPENEGVQLNRRSVFISVPVEQFTELEFNIAVDVPEELGEYVVLPKKVKLQCITKLSAAREISESDFTVAVIESEIGKDPNSAYVPLKLIRKPDFVRGTRLSKNAVELFLIR
ncbi:MAG: hypothetical protein CMN32_13345 [Saprospirales bacterium]|jgi:YbbR domain-containing protein|nr:hypothetical protein [Saprospirales bacterium]